MNDVVLDQVIRIVGAWCHLAQRDDTVTTATTCSARMRERDRVSAYGHIVETGLQVNTVPLVTIQTGICERVVLNENIVMIISGIGTGRAAAIVGKIVVSGDVNSFADAPLNQIITHRNIMVDSIQLARPG